MRELSVLLSVLLTSGELSNLVLVNTRKTDRQTKNRQGHDICNRQMERELDKQKQRKTDRNAGRQK